MRLKLPGVFATLFAFAALSASAQAETYTIDRAQIEARGARSVADAIRDVPGVSLFSYGGLGARLVYGLRGSTPQQVAVLLDGVRISPATGTAVDLGTFSTVGIARIEIIEDAQAVRYGSGAVAGVINIITGIARGGAATIAAGSYGETEARLSVGGRQLGLAYEVHSANNTYGYPVFNTFRAGTKSNDWANLGAARLTYTAALAPAWRIRAAFGIDDSHVAQSRSELYKTAHADAQIAATRESARSALTLTLSASREKYTDLVFGVSPSGAFAYESPNYYGRVQFAAQHVIVAPHDRLESGIELTRESANLSYPGGASASQGALYTTYTHAFRRASAYVGLRAESARPHDSLIEPAAGARLTLGALRLAAEMSGAYRLPSVLDWAYVWDTSAIAQIPPAKYRNAGITLSAPTAGGGMSLAWFSSIATARSTIGENSLSSAAQQVLNGLTLRASTKPFHSITADLGLTNVYRATDLARRGVPIPIGGVTSSSRLPYEPTFEGAIGLSRALGTSHVGFGVQAHIRGPYGGLATRRSTDRAGSTVLDGYMRYRFAPRGIASVRVRNVGNEVYTPVYGYPAPGRTVEFELSNR